MSTVVSSSKREAESRIARAHPRERILAAARDLFYRHGVRAVGVDAIAEAAGTNKMTLYRHFASKDLLIAACLTEVTEAVEERWNAIARAHADDPMGQLLGWVDHVSDFLLNDAERGCALANAAIELPEKDHPARRVIEAMKTAEREKLRRLCGAAGCVDPDGLADELFLLLEGARVSIQSVGVDGPWSRLRAMLRGVIENHAPAGRAMAIGGGGSSL
jgi:AcrR family transcriptional regulator